MQRVSVEPIKPRNPVQQRYYNLLADSCTPIVIGHGPAGTGKTLLAAQVGANRLKSKMVRKMIITRPVVTANENLGYLPGSLEDKMDPFIRPIMDALERTFNPSELQKMLQERTIEICPIAYARGRTFDDCFIIADEMQNSTPNQMKLLLTRIGENTKMIITGDPSQKDISGESGLDDLLLRLKAFSTLSPNMCMIRAVEFSTSHVERSAVVRDVLRLYGDV